MTLYNKNRIKQIALSEVVRLNKAEAKKGAEDDDDVPSLQQLIDMPSKAEVPSDPKQKKAALDALGKLHPSKPGGKKPIAVAGAEGEAAFDKAFDRLGNEDDII